MTIHSLAEFSKLSVTDIESRQASANKLAKNNTQAIKATYVAVIVLLGVFFATGSGLIFFPCFALCAVVLAFCFERTSSIDNAIQKFSFIDSEMCADLALDCEISKNVSEYCKLIIEKQKRQLTHYEFDEIKKALDDEEKQKSFDLLYRGRLGQRVEYTVK